MWYGTLANIFYDLVPVPETLEVVLYEPLVAKVLFSQYADQSQNLVDLQRNKKIQEFVYRNKKMQEFVYRNKSLQEQENTRICLEEQENTRICFKMSKIFFVIYRTAV